MRFCTIKRDGQPRYLYGVRSMPPLCTQKSVQLPRSPTLRPHCRAHPGVGVGWEGGWSCWAWSQQVCAERGEGAHVAELRLPRGASWLAALQEARPFERTNHIHLCHLGAVPWPLPSLEGGLGEGSRHRIGRFGEEKHQSWARWQLPWLGRN